MRAHTDRKTDLPDTGLGSGHHKYHNVPATDIDHYVRHPDEDSNKAHLEVRALVVCPQC